MAKYNAKYYMEKIKILYFVDRLGDGGGGGIQRLLLNIAKYLDKDKFQMDILKFEKKTEKLDEKFINLGCNIYSVANLKMSPYLCFKDLNSFFKNHRYDILHCHSSSKSSIPLFFAKKYKVPIRITHSHCSDFQTKKVFERLIGNILMIPNYFLSNHHFACSEPAKEWMFKHWYVNKSKYEKVHILNNAIDLEDYEFNIENRIKYREELGLKKDDIVLGSVARFREQKNHRFMIKILHECLKENDNIYLMLIGSGELEEEIKKLAIEKKVYDNILFLGNRADVNNLLSTMDVFLMPSFMEGLPFAGVEAQAAGLKCVFSKGVTKEVALTNQVFFLDLNASINEWVKLCADKCNLNYDRKKSISQLRSRGYDLKNIISELSEKYMSLIYDKNR